MLETYTPGEGISNIEQLALARAQLKLLARAAAAHMHDIPAATRIAEKGRLIEADLAAWDSSWAERRKEQERLRREAAEAAKAEAEAADAAQANET